MIVTNRDQRPAGSIYTAQQVSDLIDNVLTSGRVRQLARGYQTDEIAIGWSQFVCTIPDDAGTDFPFPEDHVYSNEDIDLVEEFIAQLKKNDVRFKIKVDRWYSVTDVQSLVQRSKRLLKLFRSGKLPKVTALFAGSRFDLTLSAEVAEALKITNGEPVCVDVPGFDRRFVVVEQSTYDAAISALRLQQNIELIREGIADVEAGRTIPLDEAMDGIRNTLLLRKPNDSHG